MTLHPFRTFVISLLLLVSAGGLRAHEDDPKLRDRQPPYSGPGYRQASHKKPPLDFPSEGVILHAWIPLSELGNSIATGADSWGYVSPSGREYAIMATNNAVAFVEVTDPANPTIVAVPLVLNSIWQDVKVYDQYAYVVSEAQSGIMVFDLRFIDNGVVSRRGTVTSGGALCSHNLAINTESGFLYRCGGEENGIRVYSLADPAQPVFAGQWMNRYIHDTQVVNMTAGAYAGREIAFCSGGFNGGSVQSGLIILDVTEKQNIVELSHLEYAGSAYAHQGWLSTDRQFFYIGDEGDELSQQGVTKTRIIDVSDLSNPREVGFFGAGSNVIDHNLYVKDNLIFEANYRGGLQVFDASNPTQPQQIAFFDTYPDDDNANFNGLWNAYPFFPSGTIIGSDIEKGLFIWSLGKRQLETIHRLIFPWISNSETFESRLLAQNHGDGDAEVSFDAHRSDGSEESSAIYTIPARGFLDVKAADLFPDLGVGSGYSVVLQAETSRISARWVTNDRVTLSPSQALAVPFPLDGGTNEMLGPSIELGFLPGGNGFQSAPVILQTSEAPADIRIYYFDREGSLIATDTVEQAAPLRPVVPRFIDESAGDLYAVASSQANLAGAVFVFNAEGQTAIGNATYLPDFTPPVSAPASSENP